MELDSCKKLSGNYLGKINFTLEIDHENLKSLFKIQEDNTEEIYTITYADKNYLEMILKSKNNLKRITFTTLTIEKVPATGDIRITNDGKIFELETVLKVLDFKKGKLLKISTRKSDEQKAEEYNKYIEKITNDLLNKFL
jgi:hypothetical protein